MIRSWNGFTPVIHPDAFISEFAYVVGNVEIGAGSSVWPGTVIRGDVGKLGTQTVIIFEIGETAETWVFRIISTDPIYSNWHEAGIEAEIGII